MIGGKDAVKGNGVVDVRSISVNRIESLPKIVGNVAKCRSRDVVE